MSLQQSLNSAWQRNSAWLWLLLPFSWLFGVLSRRRRQRLQAQFQNQPFAAPVVVVGNISVGGSGKTPLIISLVEALRARGYRPGVASRGYGGQSASYPLSVDDKSDVRLCGDEPLLIAMRCQCPVVVDPDRAAAVKHLIEKHDCNLVLSDDGMQHYAMHRDVEIAVIDGQRGLANRRLLPAGPLREPPERLNEVDLVAVNGRCAEELSTRSPVYSFQLQPTTFTRLNSTEQIPVDEWSGPRSVHAVAGIGNPQRFAKTMRELDFEVDLHPQDDHAELQPADLSFADGSPVIITAKDAVKCRGFELDNVWVLNVEAELPEGFVAAIEQALSNWSPN